jgi:hypothetical protein
MNPLHRIAKPLSIPNQILEREPEVARRLAEFRGQVNDALADQIAAHALRPPPNRGFRLEHAPADVKAAAVILRVLTKPTWSQNDIAIFDAFWREAMCFDLLADEFEAARHRIQHCVHTAKSQLLAHEPALWP